MAYGAQRPDCLLTGPFRPRRWDGNSERLHDLLDGIFCAYPAYYFWYWGEEGCRVVGDMSTGYVTLPHCRLEHCKIEAKTRPPLKCKPSGLSPVRV